MAGKQISGLDAGTPIRTDFLVKQDAAGSSNATKITLDQALGLIQVGDIPDLSSTYQEISEKDQANGYAGLNASAQLPDTTLTSNVMLRTTYDSNTNGRVDTSAGGTDIDLSASTGTLRVDSGTVSASNALTGDTLTVDSIEIDTTGATSGECLVYDGSKFAPDDPDIWEAWITPTKSGTWADLAGQSIVRYRRSKDLQFVIISGYAEKGSAITLFTLPSGYRPSAAAYGSIYGSGSTSGTGSKRILVASNGNVQVMVNADGWDGTANTWVGFTVIIPIA